MLHKEIIGKQDYRNQTMFTLIEELNLPYLKVDQTLKVVSWNEMFSFLTDIKKEELQHSSLKELAISHEIAEFFLNQIELSSKYVQITKNIYENEGSVLNITFIPEVENEHVCYFIMLEDLSLQTKYEELLTFQHQMQAVSHIAASVAHELRNPLSVIKGFLQLSHLTCDFQKYYNTIISELNRMNIIIEDFLSVSRKKSNRKWQSPSNLIQSLVELMKAECLLHSVELQVNFDKSFALCHVNESMFKQVMLNLLRNAIEAFDDGASYKYLKVSSKEVGEFVHIELIDNGKGMPKEVVEQLGKPFFTTKEKGTGVGIPLCKKIVEDHGGHFYVSSERDVGTKVVITFPLLV
ncbi:HAMP domain-containing sensor histidine kinase [Shouchella sp. 1P09AA]|uniref:two-component system sensor histidine kinase NtrB n=1 Tax=unclassified Shouchella TaxID=2893065 RepID=UPI0039A3F0B3